VLGRGVWRLNETKLYSVFLVEKTLGGERERERAYTHIHIFTLGQWSLFLALRFIGRARVIFSV
jgi:hypothetical protein